MSKERLIELIEKYGDKVLSQHISLTSNGIADYLLANGVIVAPMPMAEWLREELTEYVHKRCMEEL